jgi:hypothetical protein
LLNGYFSAGLGALRLAGMLDWNGLELIGRGGGKEGGERAPWVYVYCEVVVTVVRSNSGMG